MAAGEHPEYLYWYEGDVVKYAIGNYDETMETCALYRQKKYYCYGEGYQFLSPWYVLDWKYNLSQHLTPDQVPAQIRALHLLLYRGHP